MKKSSATLYLFSLTALLINLTFPVWGQPCQGPECFKNIHRKTLEPLPCTVPEYDDNESEISFNEQKKRDLEACDCTEKLVNFYGQSCQLNRLNRILQQSRRDQFYGTNCGTETFQKNILNQICECQLSEFHHNQDIKKTDLKRLLKNTTAPDYQHTACHSQDLTITIQQRLCENSLDTAVDAVESCQRGHLAQHYNETLSDNFANTTCNDENYRDYLKAQICDCIQLDVEPFAQACDYYGLMELISTSRSENFEDTYCAQKSFLYMVAKKICTCSTIQPEMDIDYKFYCGEKHVEDYNLKQYLPSSTE